MYYISRGLCDQNELLYSCYNKSCDIIGDCKFCVRKVLKLKSPAALHICYALQIPPHAWTLPSLYTICYALRILLHAWVPPSRCITCYALIALWVLSHAWVLLLPCAVCYIQCEYCQHVYVLPLLYIFMPLWYVCNCMLYTQCC